MSAILRTNHTLQVNLTFDTGQYGGNWSHFGNGEIFESDQPEYIYDRMDVRVLFIAVYTIVFCCCVFGNLMVILVVILSRRIRSTTNFFLANLAGADLCVGIFCVFQNLTIYLIPSWVFGEFLCKMYQFITSLSHTASIFILMVISTERYFAILHPMRCKQILTPRRLKMVIAMVWLTSMVYSSPRFIFVVTITHKLPDGGSETICILPRTKYDSQLFDMINFVLLYLCPLCVMTVLYSLIAIRLWNSHSGMFESRRFCNRRRIESESEQQSRPRTLPVCPIVMTRDTRQNFVPSQRGAPYRVYSKKNVVQARRRVIRMLIIVVLNFAVCSLPFHARKMWQYWSSDYVGSSTFSSIFTPLTVLITYCNSAINPLLYAFLSNNFQMGIRELCNTRKLTPDLHTSSAGRRLSKSSNNWSIYQKNHRASDT